MTTTKISYWRFGDRYLARATFKENGQRKVVKIDRVKRIETANGVTTIISFDKKVLQFAHVPGESALVVDRVKERQLVQPPQEV